MVEYPYITTIGALRDFLKKIKSMGVPPKITTDDLPALGFKSSNHRPIVRILQFIGFLDENNIPTDSYKDFRVEQKSRAVMAQSLRSTYSELFSIYDDAYKQDEGTLKDFFTSKTTAGPQVVARTVGTFRALCEFADFEAESPVAAEAKPLPQQPLEPFLAQRVGWAVNLNIQIQLPATQDATVYDKIFEALRKHLLTS